MLKNLFFLVLLFFVIFCYGENIKKDEFAGYFYPSNKNELNSILDNFLREVEIDKINGEILGIISPHAGYIYSGKVAAYSYKILDKKNFDVVILLGPSHQYYFEGISIYPQGYFNTILGKLKIDEEVVGEFSSLDFVSFKREYFNGEHSLEVQLPFIIKVLGNVKIVPIVFGKVSYQDLKKIADKLTEISYKKKILVVVSTDLSHYLTYDKAKEVDKTTIDFIENKQDENLFSPINGSGGRACGLLPLITFIQYSKNRNAKIETLKYLNSADTASSKERVVGYLSAVMYIPDKN